MKRKYIKVGPLNKLNMKYLNGRFKLRVFVLVGTEEDVQAAEAVRTELLERETTALYEYYTAMPRLELNKLLQAYNLPTLSALLEQLVTRAQYLMLTFAHAHLLLRYADELREKQLAGIRLRQAFEDFAKDAQ